MPNQLNFPDSLGDLSLQRPSRITDADAALVETGDKAIVFGTTDDDVVEVWACYPDGSIAGHLTLSPSDPSLTVTTVIDNSGMSEMVNFDMARLTDRMGLVPGQYSLSLNFFRNEVGSESTYKLLITQISADRTEVQAELLDVNNDTVSDLIDFVDPSVPREQAQALLSQLFGMSVQGDMTRELTHDALLNALEVIRPGLRALLTASDTLTYFSAVLASAIPRIYNAAVELLVEDIKNQRVQRYELETYVDQATMTILYQMQQAGEINPIFELV